jgi:hypothetical protein
MTTDAIKSNSTYYEKLFENPYKETVKKNKKNMQFIIYK